MTTEQLFFWNRQSRKGQLITMIRRHSEEAIRIFGKIDVKNECLPDLRETLEAYRILITPATEIQKELNCIMEELANLLVRGSEVKHIRFTKNDICRLKERAESRLSQVLHGSEQMSLRGRKSSARRD